MKSIVVYGPPGTGKTRRLMDIMARLKEERQIPASQIGFFAFTRAAADEAKKRLGVTQSKTIRTLHSIAYEASGVTQPQVVDTDKLRAFGDFIHMPMNGKGGVGFDNVELGDEYMSIHNYAVAAQCTIDAAFPKIGNLALDLKVARMVSESYGKWKRTYGYRDFNDMILFYLKKPIDIGAKYLFIDEAQDLSPLQWKMVDQLEAHAECVWIAGDDDQAIHAWAGADPHGMRRYHAADMSNVRVLDKSWRVPQRMHSIAASVIGRVAHRVEKKYTPNGELGTVRRFGEFDAVPRPSEDTLVLYRNHTGRRAAESWLMSNAVPYKAVGGFPSPFDSRWANAARTWFKLRRGDKVSDNALEQLSRCAPGLAQDIAKKNFGFKDQRPSQWMRDMPMETAEYLHRVDLNAKPMVRISTIHASKGAEADRVVLLNQMGERTYEEMTDDEHRVWYVGVTRAKKILDIVEGQNAYQL